MYTSQFEGFGKINWSKILDPLKLREKIGPVKKYVEKKRIKRAEKGKEESKAKAEEMKQIQEIEQASAAVPKVIEDTNYTPYILGGVTLLGAGLYFFYRKRRR